MELNTTSPFPQHENSLKTHEKISILPQDAKAVHGVLSEFSIIGDFHDDIKKNLLGKQQEDRVLFRHVPKKVLHVFVEAAAAEAVYNETGLDWILRVRLPPKGQGRSSEGQGRSAALTPDLESPASQTSSSLSECSPFASEISADSPGFLREADEREEDTSPDSGCNIIAQSSTLETVTSFPEQSTETQLDSKLPDPGEEKKEEREERTAEGKSPAPQTGSFCEEDTEFQFLDSTNVRRFSSAKTPSSTGSESPSTRKEVRFADALGLDLESVKHIARGKTDPPPSVPPDALRDSAITSEEPEDHGNVATTDPTPRLRSCFAQPGSSGSFQKRTYDQKVMLESVSLNDLDLSVTGSVCVVNIGYAKRIFVRYTTNGWLDFADLDAIYSGPADGGRIDKFLFKINLPESFGFASRLEFAVCYESTSQVYWDNNLEANYRVECR